MKLIQFSNEHETYIRAISADSLEKECNVYGTYFLDEDFDENLAEWKESRNAGFEEWKSEQEGTITLEDVKEFLTEFAENYSYDSSKSYEYGRPTLFVKFEDEDSYVSDPTDFYWENSHDTKIESEDEIEDCNEFISEWDGNNWRKTTISNRHSENEDVTDEYGDAFEGKIEIASTKGLNGNNSQTNWENYYYHADSKTIFVESVSLWQGSVDSFTVMTDEDDIDKIFAEYSTEESIEKYRPEMFDKYEGRKLETYRKLSCHEDMQHEDVAWESCVKVFSLETAEALESWENEQRTGGGTYYKLPSGLILHYTWSAYQGSWSGYEESEKTLADFN